MSSELITPFEQKSIATTLDQLAASLNESSVDKGFWDDEDAVVSMIDRDAVMDTRDKTGFRERMLRMMTSLKLFLVVTEVAELCDALRLPGDVNDSQKIPGFSNQEEEAADAVIRILELCHRRGWRIGEAVVAKAIYNTGREYMHGRHF